MRLGIFQIVFEWIHQGDNIPVLGQGDNLYQFVHAVDLAEACLLAAARPGAEVFNVGAERFGTMRERFLAPQVAELVEKAGDESVLAGQRREVVAVFCDLRGFTAFSARSGPEEVL